MPCFVQEIISMVTHI